MQSDFSVNHEANQFEIENNALYQAARGVLDRIQTAGYEARFAGGFVRDLILGREFKDIDIVTNAKPEVVQKIFSVTQGVGAHFGVILVKEKGFVFEVATYRKDGDYLDGRRPEAVYFCEAKEDALRRDFTINALFLNPDGWHCIDYVDGKKDLIQKQIRCVGDPELRFEEDHLRMLRAVRFAAQLGFDIEKRTWESIQHGAKNIKKVSAERVREELEKMWLSPNRVKAFDLLVESGLMEMIIPEIIKLQGVEQPPQWHPEGDVYIHTRLMLSLLEERASLPLVWSVLLHDIAKPETCTVDADGRIRFNGHDDIGAIRSREILMRLKSNNQLMDQVEAAVANHMRFKDVKKMRVAKLKRFMAREFFDEEMKLHRVDCLGSNGNLENYDFLLEKKELFAQAPLIPPKLMDGRDLMKLGIPAGPRLGKILEQMLDKQMEGQLKTYEEAKEWVLQIQNNELD
jgi:poly(A) polymerase